MWRKYTRSWQTLQWYLNYKKKKIKSVRQTLGVLKNCPFTGNFSSFFLFVVFSVQQTLNESDSFFFMFVVIAIVTVTVIFIFISFLACVYNFFFIFLTIANQSCYKSQVKQLDYFHSMNSSNKTKTITNTNNNNNNFTRNYTICIEFLRLLFEFIKFAMPITHSLTLSLSTSRFENDNGIFAKQLSWEKCLQRCSTFTWNSLLSQRCSQKKN